jgi:hypothetical protein
MWNVFEDFRKWIKATLSATKTALGEGCSLERGMETAQLMVGKNVGEQYAHYRLEIWLAINQILGAVAQEEGMALVPSRSSSAPCREFYRALIEKVEEYFQSGKLLLMSGMDFLAKGGWLDPVGGGVYRFPAGEIPEGAVVVINPGDHFIKLTKELFNAWELQGFECLAEYAVEGKAAYFPVKGEMVATESMSKIRLLNFHDYRAVVGATIFFVRDFGSFFSWTMGLHEFRQQLQNHVEKDDPLALDDIKRLAAAKKKKPN